MHLKNTALNVRKHDVCRQDLIISDEKCQGETLLSTQNIEMVYRLHLIDSGDPPPPNYVFYFSGNSLVQL